VPRKPLADTTYARSNLLLIHNLLQWMGIPPGQLLFGVNHTTVICSGIEKLVSQQTI
jgi:hypothetical protein